MPGIQGLGQAWTSAGCPAATAQGLAVPEPGAAVHVLEEAVFPVGSFLFCHSTEDLTASSHRGRERGHHMLALEGSRQPRASDPPGSPASNEFHAGSVQWPPESFLAPLMGADALMAN